MNLLKLGGGLLLCLITCLPATAQRDEIVIEGKINGVKPGRLYLLSVTGDNRTDTLGYTDFQSSEFTLKGSCKEPVIGLIRLEGYQGGFHFIGEPGHRYTATLTNGVDLYVEGEGMQQKLNLHAQKIKEYRQRNAALQAKFDSLRKENKFRSASQVDEQRTVLTNEANRYIAQFLQENDNLITGYIAYLKVMEQNLPLTQTKGLYEAMGEGARSTVAGRILAEHIKRMEGAQAGEPAPDFTLDTPEGQSVTLSQVEAKIKIVDFWASWCGSCRLNNPELKKLYDDFKEKGLEIIGVSLDNNKIRWTGAIQKDGLPWIQVSSLKGWQCETARQYNVTAIPAMFVIDEQNRIIATNLRGESLYEFISQKLK